MAALFCLAVVLYNAYTGGQEGVLTPEFFLFAALFLIFGVAYISFRRSY